MRPSKTCPGLAAEGRRRSRGAVVSSVLLRACRHLANQVRPGQRLCRPNVPLPGLVQGAFLERLEHLRILPMRGGSQAEREASVVVGKLSDQDGVKSPGNVEPLLQPSFEGLY